MARRPARPGDPPLTFGLPRESFTLITGEVGRTIHRTYGLTIGAEEWRALQRAAVSEGKHVVTCDERAATAILEWFEKSFEAARNAHGVFGEPSTVLSSCRRASAAIRAALAAAKLPTEPRTSS